MGIFKNKKSNTNKESNTNEEDLFGSLDKADTDSIKNQIICDPFKTDCIDEIFMHAFHSSIGKRICIRGEVKFKSGNTTGSQKFEADSLPELLIKIIEFCKNLEK